MKTPLRNNVVRRKPDALTCDAGLDCGGVPGEARSPGSYSSTRLGQSTTIATGMRVASIDADTAAIANAKPNRAVRKVSSGAMKMPPALAPFSAQLIANPQRLSNHGATMMLIAAPPIVAHPTDITANAAYTCQGRVTSASSTTPHSIATVPGTTTFRAP